MIWIYLFLVFLVLFILVNTAALALHDYKLMKMPTSRKACKILKSKAFWNWLRSINKCKHDQGFNYLDEKHKQCKHCGKAIER